MARQSPSALAGAKVYGIALAITLTVSAVAVSTVASHELFNGSTPVSPVLIAVSLGILWRNTIGTSDRYLAGLQWVSNTLLQAGIALVGLRLSLSGIGPVAQVAIPVVLACIGMALLTSFLIGRLFGVSQPLRLLVAAGTAVCGCTAVVAASPVSRASPEETGVALTCVVVIGCLAMIFYPSIANLLFRDNIQAAGIFLGTSIHDTSQVIGAALIAEQQYGLSGLSAVAAFTKLLRNLSLLILIPAIAAWNSSRSQASSAGTPHMRQPALPTFLIWFVLLAALRAVADPLIRDTTASGAWEMTIAAGLKASELLLICGMSSVGLGVSLNKLKEVGLAAFLSAAITSVVVAATSLTLIYLLI